jgi:hypothetical protein
LASGRRIACFSAASAGGGLYRVAQATESLAAICSQNACIMRGALSGDRGGGGGDQPDEGSRRIERGGLWEADPLGYQLPKTGREIELENKRFRGELRWDGKSWDESEPYEFVKRRDYVERVLREVKLSRTKDTDAWPRAGDVLSNIHWAEIDRRKLFDYSMNPDHPDNRGKWRGWHELGWDVSTRERRIEQSFDIRNKVHDLLPESRIELQRTTLWGVDYRVWSGLIGPNDRHATLITGWREQFGQRSPRLVTIFLKVHREQTGDDR